MPAAEQGESVVYADKGAGQRFTTACVCLCCRRETAKGHRDAGAWTVDVAVTRWSRSVRGMRRQNALACLACFARDSSGNEAPGVLSVMMRRGESRKGGGRRPEEDGCSSAKYPPFISLCLLLALSRSFLLSAHLIEYGKVCFDEQAHQALTYCAGTR